MSTITWSLRKVKASELKPNAKNPKKRDDAGFERLKKSLEKFGRVFDGIANADHSVIDGHSRLELSNPDDDLLFFFPSRKLSKKEYVEMNAMFDEAKAGSTDMQIVEQVFTEAQMDEWGLDKTIADPVEDDFEVPEGGIETDIVLGDLFEIGEHRLLCGDSTDSDAVAKLMDGKLFHLLATSPPYNQGNNKGDLLTNGKKAVRLYDDKNADNRTSDDYYKFCVDILKTSFLFKNDDSHTVCWNVAYNAKSRCDYGKIVFGVDNPFEVKETIIWDKGHAINLPQIGIYSRRCEFVFVMSSNDKYHTSQTYNDCRWNIYNISTMNSQTTDGNVEHRAAFPIKFAEQMINDFSIPNDLIYEPFTGSGTTMVAAHQLNRKCYGMELDPKYCQVIIDRMRKLDPSLTIKKNGIAI